MIVLGLSGAVGHDPSASKTAMSQARTSCNVPGDASQKVEVLYFVN